MMSFPDSTHRKISRHAGLIILLVLSSALIASYWVIEVISPSFQGIVARVPRAEVANQQDASSVSRILAERAGLFDITDFREDPGREPGGKISYINVFFKVMTKVPVKNAIISAYLTQEGLPDIIFDADPISSLETDLSSHTPQSVDFQIRLNQSVLEPKFRNGPFLLQVDVSTNEYGWVVLSGNHNEQDNLATIKKCPLELLLDKEYGPYNCPVYVYKLVATRPYSLDDFVE